VEVKFDLNLTLREYFVRKDEFWGMEKKKISLYRESKKLDRVLRVGMVGRS
jgi:hypothetical protein